jgi:hypothetical protein
MDETNRNFMLIGLHKLAGERDDGLIPELLALYRARDQLAAAAPEPQAHDRDDHSAQANGDGVVIQFKPYWLARKRR